MAFSQGYLNYLYNDPEYPDWVPGYNTALNLLAPVPDFVYQVCLIEGGGTYRITGHRGTTRFVDLTIFSSLPNLGGSGPVLGRVSLDSLPPSSDGGIDLLLSPSRPTGYTGHWVELDARARRLQVRHAAYDWLNEVDARLTIERLDRSAGRPRQSAADIAHKLEALSIWTEKSVMWGIRQIAAQRERGMINRLEPFDFSSVGGYDPRIQAYCEGLFQLADDEALVIDTALPEQARYWSILLADDQYSTINWMYHQSSLNGYQARVDADGRFRAVIATQDPGVPNWLDTAGRREGVIQLRWNECSSQPIPTVRKMRLHEVGSFLPADTPRVSAEQREQSLSRRRRGAQLRRRW
jgi:hypothetical protein